MSDIKTYNKMKTNNTIKLSLCLCLSGMALSPVEAQSKFHVDLDYHYNLGLSQKLLGSTYGRKDYKMAATRCGSVPATTWLRSGR